MDETSLDIASSPFASMIGTNCFPSAAERASVKEFLVAPQLEKSRLEAELSHVQALLKRNEGYLHAHQALLSPIRKLPAETLAEILKQCLPTDTLYPVRSLKEGPLLFTTICRDWREVSVNTPQLWKSLHVYLPPHLSRDTFSQRNAGIALWLERSGSLPLSISFHGRTTRPSWCTEFDELQMNENMEYCIRALLRFSDRIAVLTLSLSIPAFTLFDKLSPSHFPALVFLRLRDANLYEGSFTHLSNNPAIIPFASLLGRMPHLKALRVHQFHLRNGAASSFGLGSLPSIDLSTRGITTFGVLVTATEGLALLSRMPLVQSVNMVFRLGRNLNDTHPSPSAVVNLVYLSEMRLAFTSTRSIDQTSDVQTEMTLVCDSIQCPSLRSFSICCHDLFITQLPFRGLPLHTLETLELDISISKEPLFECLSLVSNISSLRIHTTDRLSGPNNTTVACAFEESHLVGLTQVDIDVDPLCPKLQKCQFLERIVSGLNVSPGAIVNFIKSRRKTLKDCDFFFMHKPSFTSEQLNSLRKYKEDGLNLRLHWAKPFSPSNWDTPTMGLPNFPYISQQPLYQNYDALDAMEGPYGTEVMI
ncbi:hypothetical protein J3R30DRAFT_1238995 [Lentinula aciculospora]|uniref:F-box domain-containing protein n=1 Tax=Lentinula aciculospora TaxID=153920 RepID=A0A9W9DH07_9AGAR|nr:hypothetical protein J3R30DRAFT_1238995 [Lentinula aciculospora]